ncbi:histidyl-tRNA synthetase [Archaeoglobus sulfaticallidus PM70-1]|uniref:Histidine--tRNA ligase n=1 Tax=Archaeoglobus sulfaticallidus PM70-1 TaxID=387631 RepID=N0BJL0_9EURY|nr:histidine--tRNA ligase [Archaeoglobus sulfaticallidus]AGK60671.1 histidyl-tRNA synthetase [Archaeoglobus sulfaticallidus PM70-1]
MKVERPRGTRDFLPDVMERRRSIERIMRETAERYGYREICTPTFEHLELFTIKSGEGIVEEIYAFKDKSGRDLALRPELTAPVMRVVVNECSVMQRPMRFYYFSNCFRYENPQKGRYREFWQFGVELVGSGSYLADLEVIVLAYNILKNLNIEFELRIGHVGLMRELFKDLSEERYRKVMRLIDKNNLEELEKLQPDYAEMVRELIALKGKREVIDLARRLVPEFDFEHLERLSNALDLLGIEYSIDFSIVRGLDYYTGIVFEAFAKRGLGAQNQICGGGSYRLTHLFGGEDIPSTGFAIGFDRIAEICEIQAEKKGGIVVASTPAMRVEAMLVAEMLRKEGLKVYADVMERNLRKQLSFANSINAEFAIIVGEDEYKAGEVVVKDLETGKQERVAIDSIASEIKRMSRASSL